MKYILIGAISVILAGCAVSSKKETVAVSSYEESQKGHAEMCEKVTCQRNIRVVLKKKDGTIYDRTFDVLPVVQDNGVFVVAGQTVNFEVEVVGERLTSFKLVNVVSDPSKTIVAKFEQMDNGGMMLSLKNPFARHVKFNMGIMPLGKDGLYKTSSCPVVSGGGSYESWPYPIFQVFLSNPRLLAKNVGMSCGD